MRNITNGLFTALPLAFLFTASASPPLDTGSRIANGVWQCFDSCMSACPQSARLATRNTTARDLLAPERVLGVLQKVV